MLPINITALDDTVSLVHIPITATDGCRNDQYSTRIYWTIERAESESDEFFNVTSNRLEIAIFASSDLIDEQWRDVALVDPSIRLSEGWRGFEIDSGDVGDEVNSGNYDSPHLRHVSAPLSKEGISILYQSSYHADFLLVKETDFARTSAIFAEHGWTINPTSHPSPRRTHPSPPTSVPATPALPSTPHDGAPTFSSTPLTPTPMTSSDLPDLPIASRSTSASETSPHRLVPADDITSLPSPLAFVGFHRSSQNFQLHTGLLQKYITWPIRCRAQFTAGGLDGAAAEGDRPFISYTRTQDGASLVTEVRVIRGMFKGQEEGMLCGEEIGTEWESEAESDMGIESGDEGSETEVDERHRESRRGWRTRNTERVGVHIGDAEDDDRDDDDEDATPRAVFNTQLMTPPPEYFSYRPKGDRFPPTSGSHPSARLSHQRHKKAYSVPASPGLDLGLDPAFDPDERRPRKRRSTANLRAHIDRFIPGLTVESRPPSRERRAGRKRCIQLDMGGAGTPAEEATSCHGAYHLDKSGLVTRFATQLQLANIRMLYLSTFHTANILVDARDVSRARKLLTGGAL